MTGQMVTQLRRGEQPRFSPDGSQILFVRENGSNGNGEIWVMDTNGGRETQLTANTSYDFRDPSWSNDGGWIVFASNEGRDAGRNHNFDIWMMRADGSSPTSLTTNGSHDDSPSWSRNGRKIYFRSNRGGAWNIWQFEPVL
jgi:TolB protein